MRDVKEVHTAVGRHVPSSLPVRKKTGVWIYGREVSSPVSGVSALMCRWLVLGVLGFLSSHGLCVNDHGTAYLEG